MLVIKKLIPFAIIILLVLSVLYVIFSGKSEKTIEVPSGKEFISVQVQTIENNKEVKSKTVTLTDKEKIDEILRAVDGLKTKQSTITNTEKEIKDVDSYFFYFENKKERDPRKPFPYSFFITEKGYIYYTHNAINSLDTPQRTVEAHPDVLKKLKEITGVQ
ncbi:hypothetical protein [Kurthia gibsonii]|uniref:hypothetical protein n=1 Tax=Kurthia gibsonii TaxID=33946 RepID=UPI0031B6E447